ncbi:MAG: hypothetical protein IJX12_00250 [Lachnospiraceae bacterium]|nr:hypothetical protein [Lachnospiraceae bacterium]
MEKGTLGELFLTRSVTKHIRKHNKKLSFGAGVGKDYSFIAGELEGIVMTEGWGTTPILAWTKAMNNFSVSGGTAIGVRLLFLMPETIQESELKGYMTEFNQLADGSLIQIMGGHTQVGEEYRTPSFVVTALGKSGTWRPDIKGISEGDSIIMTKYAGLLGTDLLITGSRDKLRERFSDSYINGGIFGEKDYSVSKEASLVSKLIGNVTYMHDVSCGGVYGALWQLGVAINKGINISHFDIPIKQETIEFCEQFDINPYMLEGTGSLLMVAKHGEDVVQCLETEGFFARIIGKVTGDKERTVSLGTDSEKRFLAPVKGDEIYKVVSAY